MKSCRPPNPSARRSHGPFAVCLLAMVGLTAAGCTSFTPDAAEHPDFLARAKTQEADGLKVSVVALTPAESQTYFGEDLAEHEVQPVWLKIENQNDFPVWYLPLGTDPSYFSASEVAFMFHHVLGGAENQKIDDFFLKNGFVNPIPPKSTTTGFVLTHKSEGQKFINVELLSSARDSQFSFVAPVPGGRWDFDRVDAKTLYPPEKIAALDLPQLKAALEALPCCVTNKEGTKSGDPLDLVIVGTPPHIIFPFVERGWHLTEPFDLNASRKAAMAFIFGEAYESSPVSPLYVYGRPQDIALQKIRNKISQRNHMRAWLAPFTYDGQMVFVGQISRDIGVRLTSKSWYLTTHKIDPDVDSDRNYLLQDILASGYVKAFGLVGGVGAAPSSAPRGNLTGDPYFTDGKRLVLFLSNVKVPLDKVEQVKW